MTRRENAPSSPTEVPPAKNTELLVWAIAPTLTLWIATRTTLHDQLLKIMHPLAAWFAGGAMTFLVLLALAWLTLRREPQYRSGMQALLDRLRLRGARANLLKPTTLGIAGTGAAMGLAALTMAWIVPTTTGEPFSMEPPFLRFEPLYLTGDLWVLWFWPAFFILNIFGEEIAWRGVLQPKLEARFNRYGWLFGAAIWLMFHISFGWMLMPTLLPIILLIPWLAWRTRSTWPGIWIHGLINGGGFLATIFGFV